MTGLRKVLVAGWALWFLAAAGVALAQNEPPATPAGAAAPGETSGAVRAYSSDKGLGVLGLCVGAGLTVFAGAWSISNISARATESIARQPEAAGSMFLAWLLPAAMIEGAMLFGVLVCFMALDLLR
jgi:F-type H+-transporting ATPase subunit c